MYSNQTRRPSRERRERAVRTLSTIIADLNRSESAKSATVADGFRVAFLSILKDIDDLVETDQFRSADLSPDSAPSGQVTPVAAAKAIDRIKLERVTQDVLRLLSEPTVS